MFWVYFFIRIVPAFCLIIELLDLYGKEHQLGPQFKPQ